MGSKLPPEQLELYFALDRILWEDWDPIGVSSMDGSKDEYHQYLPHVFSLALKNSSAREIAEYLYWAAGTRMGLDSTVEKNLQIAKKIVGISKKLLG